VNLASTPSISVNRSSFETSTSAHGHRSTSERLLFDVVLTLDSSAWYFGNTVFVLAVIAALAAWALYTATGRRPWAIGTA
jgi:hypothetical protein